MQLTEIDRTLLKTMLAAGGVSAYLPLDVESCGGLVEDGLAIREDRKSQHPGHPDPVPIYRISDLGKERLGDG